MSPHGSACTVNVLTVADEAEYTLTLRWICMVHILHPQIGFSPYITTAGWCKKEEEEAKKNRNEMSQ
jgi:hypothetical protein